jgi:hypothetical protein
VVSAEEARQRIEEQRAKIKQAQERLRQAQLPSPTKQQLLTRGLEGLRQRKLQAQQRRQIKQAQVGVKEVGTQFEVEAGKIEQQIQQQEAQRQAQINLQKGIEEATRVLKEKGASSFAFARQPAEVKEIAKKIVGSQEGLARQLSSLGDLGLSPIFSQGRLTGFEDKTLQQSVNLDNLINIRPDIVPDLKKLGFIEDVKTPQINLNQIAFKDIITGELISARKAPSPTFKPIVIDKRGREIRDVSLFEQASLKILPEIKERTLLEEIKFRGLVTTGLRKFGELSKKLVGKQPVAIEDEPLFARRGTFVPTTKEEREAISEVKTEISKKAISDVAQTAPFFIPIVGAGLLIGTGLERILTKGGIGELQQLGLKLESIGLPSQTAVLLPAVEIIGGTALLTAEIKTLKKLKAFQKNIKEPQTTFISGKQKEKLKQQLFQQLEPDIVAGLNRNKLTATRAYQTTAGDRIIQFVEFGKAGGVKDVLSGKRVFYALEIEKSTGKVKGLIGGLTIEKSAGSGTEAITKLFRVTKKKKFFIPKTKKELITFIEKTKVNVLAKRKGISVLQAKSEIRLLERKEVKSLGQLFLDAEAKRRGFVEAFKKAKPFGKAETITLNLGKKGKFTLAELRGQIIGRELNRAIKSSEIGGQIFRPSQPILKLGRKKPSFNLNNIIKLLRDDGIKVTAKLRNLISKGLKTKQITKFTDIQISRILPPSTLFPTATPPALAQIIIAEGQSIIVPSVLPAIISKTPSVIGVITKKPITKTKIKPAITTSKVKEKLKTGLLAKSESKLIEPSSVEQISKSSLVEKTALGLQPKLATGLTQKQRLRQQLKPKLIQRQRPITKATTPPNLRFPARAKPFVPPDVAEAKRRRARARAKKRRIKIAYIPLIKERGVFKKLTKDPMSLAHAKALAGLAVDRTLSAQFKLKKVTNPKKVIKIKPPKFPEKKFRSFKRRGDKRIPLSDFGHIERRKHRLDKKNETQTIQQFKRRKAYKSLFKRRKKKK